MIVVVVVVVVVECCCFLIIIIVGSRVARTLDFFMQITILFAGHVLKTMVLELPATGGPLLL